MVFVILAIIYNMCVVEVLVIVLTYISLMTNDAEYLLIYLNDIISSNVYLNSFSIFRNNIVS